MNANFPPPHREQSLEVDYNHADSMAPRKNRQNDRQAICLLYASSVVAASLSIAVASMQTSERVDHRSTTAEWGQPLFISSLYATSCLILMCMTGYFEWHRGETFESVHRVGGPVSFSVKFSLKGEKVNLYLRLGLAMFGMMSVGHVAVRFVEDANSVHNHLALYIKSILEMLFIILQTMFILRYHRLVILQYNEIMGAGLVHLLTTNLCIWADISVGKIDKTLSIGKFESVKFKHEENITLSIGSSNGTEGINWGDISFYLLPTVSEYCLLAAALLYEITIRIGQASFIEIEKNLERKQLNTKKTILDCRKCRKNAGSWYGIFTVLVVVGLTILTATSPKHKDRSKNIWKAIVILSEEAVLCLSGLVFVITAVYKIRKLKFSIATRQSHVEEFLLYTAFFFCTNYTISTIILTANFEQFARPAGNITRCLLICRCTLNALELIQILLQTYMIQDSFYRCSDKIKHQITKPGRQSIVALLGINLAYWIQQSFQVKNADILFLMDNEKGSYGWILFVVTMPISLFYRYHCTVCLSQCFNKLYEDETQRFEEMWRYRVDPITDMIIPDMGSFAMHDQHEKSESNSTEQRTPVVEIPDKDKRTSLFRSKLWRTVDIPDELYADANENLIGHELCPIKPMSISSNTGACKATDLVIPRTIRVELDKDGMRTPPVFIVTEAPKDELDQDQASGDLQTDYPLKDTSRQPIISSNCGIGTSENEHLDERHNLTISGSGWRRPSKLVTTKSNLSSLRRRTKSMTLPIIRDVAKDYLELLNRDTVDSKSPVISKPTRQTTEKTTTGPPLRRRRTLRNLETAKYRVLAAEMAHRLVLQRTANTAGSPLLSNSHGISSDNLLQLLSNDSNAPNNIAINSTHSLTKNFSSSFFSSGHQEGILANAVNETAALTIAPVESRLLNKLQLPRPSTCISRFVRRASGRDYTITRPNAANTAASKLKEDQHSNSCDVSPNSQAIEKPQLRRNSTFKKFFRSTGPCSESDQKEQCEPNLTSEEIKGSD